jgi:pilus assembly protein Flp/PilA
MAVIVSPGRLPHITVRKMEAEKDTTMKNLIQRFVREDEGQDLVEYALLLGLIAVVLVGAITTLQTAITGRFNEAHDVLAS